MEKASKLYQNKFDKVIKNNKNMCVVKDCKIIDESIRETLKKVYAGLENKYNTKVLIETNNNVYDTSLIYKGTDILVTKENSVINVNDIKKIAIKK